MSYFVSIVLALCLAAGLDRKHAERFYRGILLVVDIVPKGLGRAVIARIQATEGATAGIRHEDVNSAEQLTPEFVGKWIDGQRARAAVPAVQLRMVIRALNELGVPQMDSVVARVDWLGFHAGMRPDRETLPAPEPWRAEISHADPCVVLVVGNGGFSSLRMASPDGALGAVQQLMAQFQNRTTVSSSDGRGKDFAAELRASPTLEAKSEKPRGGEERPLDARPGEAVA